MNEFNKWFAETFSFLLFFLSGKSKRNLEILKHLKDCHLGEICFIIGNGPSLLAKDLEILQERKVVTFSANNIRRIFPETTWRPTYYCVSNDNFARYTDILSETIAQKKFFSKASYSNTRKVKGNCYYLNIIRDKKLLKNPRFSDNLPSHVFAIGTVTYVSIQLAFYMGIKEIFLLGVDNVYSLDRKENGSIVVNEDIKSYFGELGILEKESVGSAWEMNTAYLSAKNYAERHGRKIYNATRGGNLEVFDRVSFDTIFK